MSRFTVAIAIFTFLVARSSAIPPLCSPAEPWSVNGRDLVGQHKGRLLLLAFMPTQCDSCALEFKKLNAIGMKLRDIKVVVAAPHYDTPENIRRAAEEFRYVEIVQESVREPLWRWLGVSANDRLIFDRCGRLAKVIRAKKAETDSYHDILNSLKSALNYAHCGWCQYDNDGSTAAPYVQPSQVTAYLITSTQRNAFHAPVESKPLSQTRDTRRFQETTHVAAGPYQPASPNTAYQQRQQYHQEMLRQSQAQAQHASAQRAPSPFTPQSRQPQTDYRIYSNPEYDRTRMGSYVTAAPPVHQTQAQAPPGQSYRGEFVNERGETRDYGRNAFSAPAQTQQRVAQTFGQDRSVQPTQESQKVENPFYDDSDVAAEEQEYIDYIAEWTTPLPTPRAQIPSTHAPLDPSLWPTLNPRYQPLNPNFPKAQLCAAYTDDICFKQQEQLQPNEIHECCQNRLLLTDICVPGKCSNTTLQLCCIQKFLQSKLSCCEDPTMSEPGQNGFEFSKCCYEHFIDEKDECCPFKYADLQWRFVHELCLPHVNFDLSNVKIPTHIPGTTVTAQFDFSKSDKWKFECRHGQKTKHYSYYPEEERETVQLDE